MSGKNGPDIEGLTYVQHLGTGGYSEVYLYERQKPKMRVAVKVLNGAKLTPNELSQFADEAETMAELADHPYIVQVFSTGTTADGRPYLVMKYYPGENLGRRAASQRLSIAEVLRTGIQIGSAVETAHRAGILHRDIKPANVLVGQYGEPGLTDFGIAGRAAEVDEDDDLGVSIPWSPPEVLSGASNGTSLSDVYSLGATVWHLVVGRSPFELPGGDNTPRELMARVLRTPPPATGRADAPTSLDRLLQHAMNKSPQYRPTSALAFTRALQGIEQEMRLPRTEIVVGSDHVAASEVRQSGSLDATRMRATRPTGASQPPPASPQAPVQSAESPFGAQHPIADRTVARRPPAAVSGSSGNAQWAPPAPPGTAQPAQPPAANQPKDTSNYGAFAEPSGQAAGVPHANVPLAGVPHTAAPPTTMRPVRPSGPVQRPSGPATPSGDLDEAPRTTVRPQRVAGEPAVAAQIPEPQRAWRLRSRYVTAGVVGIVLAAVVGMVVALTSGGHSAQTGNGQPKSGQPTGAGQGGFGIPPGTPVITSHYDARSASLTFTWTPVPNAVGYVYWYQTNPNTTYVPRGSSTTSVTTQDPAHVCVTVQVSAANGLTSHGDKCGA